MIETLLRDLQRPEYLHVLLNPLPVYGLGIGLFGLVASLYLGTRGGQMTALILVFACAAAAWPVAHYGEGAESRVLAVTDEDGAAWLKVHAQRAESLIYLFYALAVSAAAAIFVPKKWPHTARSLAWATLVLGMVSLGAGSYVASAGGKIKHREFRTTLPPPASESG